MDCVLNVVKKNTGFNWCKSCNSEHFLECFPKSSSTTTTATTNSGCQKIDEFIKHVQVYSTSRNHVIEWIPYERLGSFKLIGKGGFGIVQEATWFEGQIDSIIGWNYLQSRWERHGRTKVVIKILNDSFKLPIKFLREVGNK